jgi:hypothetical protein
MDRILTGYNRNGYLQVTLTKDGVQFARLVHRLVATAFIPNDDPSRVYVDHIDTILRNNHVSNLRWVTPKENMNNELTKQNISAGHMRKSPKVYQIGFTGNVVRITDNAIEMEKQTGVRTGTIQKIANYYKRGVKNGFSALVQGEQKTHDNCIFIYENEYPHIDVILQNCKTCPGLMPIKVVQINATTNEIIATYNSMYEASKKLNINYSAINQVYNYYKHEDATRPKGYKLKTTHGYIFKDSLQVLK